MSNSNTIKHVSHFYVKIDGSDAAADFMRDLEQVIVESSLHLPDVATLILHDPRLKWADDKLLSPGKTLQISAKAGADSKPIFDGEIVEIEPSYEPETQRLHVRAFDRMHRLSRGRQVRSFQNVSDGDLVRKLAQEVGLQVQVGPTAQVHDYVLQGNETNLAFLQRRAAALGYLLYVDKKTLHCEAPKAEGAPIELKWIESLVEFRPRLTTIGQINEVMARGWDPEKKQAIVGQANKGNGAPQVGGWKNGGDTAKEAYNLTAKYLVAHGPLRTQKMADLQAQAVADRQASHFIEAEGVCGGNPAMAAGVKVKISAVGDRFSGTYFVTSATHTYHVDQGYKTSFTVSGLNPATLLAMLAPEAEASPTTGLVIGVVTDNDDKDGLGRVKVKYPWLSNDHASYWARVVSVGAGATRGVEFLPEINDEVLIGFENGNIDHPYVLGGLWNGKDKPPKKSTEIVSGGKVKKRHIQSRTGHKITLDDDDSGGGIIIEDSKGNIIKLDTASNKITVQAKGDILVKAGGNLTMEAAGKATVKGATVDIEGSGTVTVKGSTINLN